MRLAASLLLLASVASAALSPGAAAPDFSLPDLSGKPVAAKGFRGKAVLVDFWATWCDACVQSMPDYERLYKRLGPQRFVVLGVAERTKAAAAADFARKRGVTYPLLVDEHQDVFDAFGARALPTAFLIDPSGKIARRWVGIDDKTEAEIERAVTALAATSSSR